MPSAYLSTSGYDHIDQGYIPADEVEALRVALASGEIVSYLSLANVGAARPGTR